MAVQVPKDFTAARKLPQDDHLIKRFLLVLESKALTWDVQVRGLKLTFYALQVKH